MPTNSPASSTSVCTRPKPGSTDGFVGSSVWGRVAAGLVRVCGPARFGACRTGVRGWCGWWRVGLGCAARGAERYLVLRRWSHWITPTITYANFCSMRLKYPTTLR